MSLGLSISQSGIQDALLRQSVSANNVANSQTPDFKASRVDSVEVSGGGVRPGAITKNPILNVPSGSSNVDIAREMVDQLKNKASVKINAATLRTRNGMLGELLDILG